MQTGKNTKAISKGRKQISLSSALTTIHIQSNTYSRLIKSMSNHRPIANYFLNPLEGRKLAMTTL